MVQISAGKSVPLSNARSPAGLQPPVLPWLLCLSAVPVPSVPDLDLGFGLEASLTVSGCSRPGRPASASENQFSSPSLPWSSSAGIAPWPAARALTAVGRSSPLMEPGEEVRKSRHTQAPDRDYKGEENQSWVQSRDLG